MSEFIPKWHRELDIFSRIKPLIILEGNVLDVYRYPVEGSTPEGSILRLTSYLHYKLKDSGYDNIVFYDSMTGFYNNCEDGYIQKFASLIDERLNGSEIKADFSGKHGFAPFMVKTALSQNKSATAIVMNLVSRYIASPENMSQENVDSFTILLKSLLEAADVYSDKGVLKNLLILIVNKINDLPVWFYHENPNVKVINIKTPSKEEREQLLLGDNFKSFFVFEIFRDDMEYYSIKPDELEKLKNRFTALTDGFSFTEINGLRRLCKNERVRIGNLCDVVDLYKYGIRENPWRSLDVNDLKSAHDDFRKRVKGQNFALIKTLDIIKRTVTGLSGLQHSSGTKPKGVLFFAGPTGTGKTETAKTLAQKLFGDESCCIRFDMSEFSQSHSDQKLMGAPPGYVGYESGGQLTNAVKNNPFSILLFDEIEKAHPSVMDKFLQILEDGRMTDGQGNTVYFSETIIIFTSNLGIFTRDKNGDRRANVSPEMSYSEIQKRVRLAIEDYFKLELGRPEILNRIGENIVVFDFIRPEVTKLILDASLEKIISRLELDKKIKLSISANVRAVLIEKSLDNVQNGARGIGNIVESLLINPLSRYLFDNGFLKRRIISITGIDAEKMPFSLICSDGGEL